MNKEFTVVRCEKCGKLYEPLGKPHKCKKTASGVLEINCNKCLNCTGESCKVYGDNPNEAVELCAKDGFKNYMWH